MHHPANRDENEVNYQLGFIVLMNHEILRANFYKTLGQFVFTFCLFSSLL